MDAISKAIEDAISEAERQLEPSSIDYLVWGGQAFIWSWVIFLGGHVMAMALWMEVARRYLTQRA